MNVSGLASRDRKGNYRGPGCPMRSGPVKIAFVAHGTDRTGGVRTLFEYCNGLMKRGHEVGVVSLGSPGDASWFPLTADVRYTRLGSLLNIYNVAAGPVGRLPRFDTMYELARLVPEVDVAVATYSLTATAVSRASRCRSRAYFAQHFEPLFFADEYEKRWALETYHLPLAKAANSTWLAERIREETGEAVPVITPGLDLSKFHPRTTSREPGRKRIVSFAKATPWKGFSDLMEALRILEGRREDFELVTFGAWQPPQFLRTARQTHVPSPSDDELAALYSSADVVVSPSWYESFPLPPLEAMACGAPVVTTSLGTEDYAVHLANAVVVPPREPAELADGIGRVLEDASLAETLRKGGPGTAKRFDWESASGKMEAFLQQVVR